MQEPDGHEWVYALEMKLPKWDRNDDLMAEAGILGIANCLYVYWTKYRGFYSFVLSPDFIFSLVRTDIPKYDAFIGRVHRY